MRHSRPRPRALLFFVAVALCLVALITLSPDLLEADPPSPTLGASPHATVGLAARPTSEAFDPRTYIPFRRVRVPVLMYHYISDPPPGADKYRLDLSVSPKNFQLQLQWLKDNQFTSISPQDLIDALLKGTQLPRRPVLLTFDDGYEDAYSIAFPLLKEFGFKGTFFVVTDWMDSGKGGHFTWAQAREMSRAGMSIESHSRRHKDLTQVDAETLHEEIVGSLDAIEKNVGIRPNVFCYPSGHFNVEAMKALHAAGVVAAFTTRDGIYHTDSNMLRLPRVRMRDTTTIKIFDRELTWNR